MQAQLFAALALGSIALLASPAQAQGGPDIEGAIVQQGQITDLLRGEVGSGQVRRGDDGEIEGEAGIYIMQLNEIYFVGATGGVGFAENPERSQLSAGASLYGSAGVTAGVQTRLGEKVDFGARVSVSGVDYVEEDAPSSRSAVVSVTAGAPIGDTPIYASVALFGGENYDEDFDNGATFYGATTSVSAGFPLGERTVLRTGAGVTRQWSDISENDSTAASVSANLLHQAQPQLVLGADIQVNYTVYDDFYEDVTFLERDDWSYRAGVSANWEPLPWLSVGASVGYERRDSSFFIAEYEGLEAEVGVTVKRRF